MKNLVRGGAILSLVGLFVAFIYAQTATETSLSSANDSQLQLNNSIFDKIVEKTVSSKAVGASRGTFSATAYCLKGRTAMGHGVRRGIIAADPRVLPLGSRINISGGYAGTYLVSDTGGKIKGKRLDIWMPNCSEARRFGRRTVSVNYLGR